MRKGQAIGIPGISRSGDAWIVRATAQSGSLKIEKTKKIHGTQAEAIAALSRLKEEAASQLSRAKSGETAETIGAFAPRWIDSLRERGKTRAYAETRAIYLERFILPKFGRMLPSEIKPRHLEEWKAWLLLQRSKDGRPYSHGTIATAWATMRHFLRFVVVHAELPRHPMADIRLDVRGGAVKRKESLDAEELARLIRAAEHESKDIRAMIIVAFSLGLRFSEMSALHWGDIDFQRAEIRIERSQVAGVIGPPKTESSRRTVYLPPEIASVLRAHRAEQGRTSADSFGGIVFPSKNGGYRYPQVLVKPLERCCARAGIEKHITAHCARHTAVNLLRRAAGEIVVRAMIGHSTAEMTARYSRVGRDERAGAFRAAFGDAFDLDPDLSHG